MVPQPDLDLTGVNPEKKRWYSADMSGAEFTRCGGNLQGNLESCASFARVPGEPDVYAIRDADLGAQSPELRLNRGEIVSLYGQLQQDWTD